MLYPLSYVGGISPVHAADSSADSKGMSGQQPPWGDRAARCGVEPTTSCGNGSRPLLTEPAISV
jgi:hypothetical protein